MTTIAANLECMAADTKVTVGENVAYHTPKIFRIKKMIIGAAGGGSDCQRVMEWAERDFKGPTPEWASEPDDDDAVWALILKADGLYFLSQTDPAPERMDEAVFAIGSGGLAARVAMMLGKTPAEAVELACQVDNASGLPITVIHLDVNTSRGKP